MAASGTGEAAEIDLASARCWPTVVPREVFGQVTGASNFPPELSWSVDGGALAYFCKGNVRARIGGVAVELITRWELGVPPGGGDTHEAVVRGTRAEHAPDALARAGDERDLPFGAAPCGFSCPGARGLPRGAPAT